MLPIASTSAAATARPNFPSHAFPPTPPERFLGFSAARPDGHQNGHQKRCAAASPAVMRACRGLFGNLGRIAGIRGWTAGVGHHLLAQSGLSSVLLCRGALPGFDSRRYAAGESQLVEF